MYLYSLVKRKRLWCYRSPLNEFTTVYFVIWLFFKFTSWRFTSSFVNILLVWINHAEIIVKPLIHGRNNETKMRFNPNHSSWVAKKLMYPLDHLALLLKLKKGTEIY